MLGTVLERDVGGPIILVGSVPISLLRPNVGFVDDPPKRDQR
jgi:hypothetical protein